MLRCRYCGSIHLRPSRMRWSDLARLPLLQLPVRCWTCRERDFVGIKNAREIRQAAKERQEARNRVPAETPVQ